MTLFLTRAPSLSSFLVSSKANNLLILVTLFGPTLLGSYLSENPSIGFSPSLTKERDKALISYPTMHPLTDFLFLSPFLFGP